MNLETSDVSWSFASNCKKYLIELFFKRSFKEIASKFSLLTLHSFLWKSYDFLSVYSSLISTTYLQTFTFFRNLISQICSCICSSVIRTCSIVYDIACNSFGSLERNRRINTLKEFFMLNLLPSHLRMFALNFFKNHWSFEKLSIIKRIERTFHPISKFLQPTSRLDNTLLISHVWHII